MKTSLFFGVTMLIATILWLTSSFYKASIDSYENKEMLDTAKFIRTDIKIKQYEKLSRIYIDTQEHDSTCRILWLYDRNTTSNHGVISSEIIANKNSLQIVRAYNRYSYSHQLADIPVNNWNKLRQEIKKYLK